ncbi:LRR receptor-like serine/threonine-protein kinase GSO1 [Morus notabilis]|uniref:LRR receptor-like serine/threonine-protein kinase GSO1 n=1 Tax=Morus notabilis TaxID=981085 RepID=W9QJM1_9ROSA|nr:LRR receptor-like serine/threonine-protein kinase GSO1 [Morus notabilis]
MSWSLPRIAFFMTLLFYGSGAGEQQIRCIEVERQALLKIKQDLHEIKEGFLSSWGNEEEKRDCCEWYGVQCSNNSDHVIALDLSPSSHVERYAVLFTEDNDFRFLQGNISPSLRELKHLTYLDLSVINFTGHGIPSFISTFSKLRYLNLSYTFVSGEIPPKLANLSNLEVLDLGYNSRLRTRNVEWVFRLSSLRHLDLSYTNMSQATNWMQVVNKLPYLTNLQLRRCKLPNVTSSSLSRVNSSTSLSVLDLSWNKLSVSVFPWLFSFGRGLVHLDLLDNVLEGPIPKALLNMSTLEYLDLGSNELEGSIPEALGNLTALTYLHLGSNHFEGEFPKSLWGLCKLRELYAGQNNLSNLNLPENIQSLPRCTHHSLEALDFSYNRIMGSFPNLSLFSSLKSLWLSSNQLNGTVPEAIGQLSQLEYLDISGNSLKGAISEAHFSKSSKLSHLSLSGNSMILNISSDWNPPFQLDSISLGSCKVGPRFPKWLQTQKNYSKLNISYAGISDSIPDWFWDLSSEVYSIDLSHNQIHGTTPNSSIEFIGYPEIDLSSNKLEGSIPVFIFKAGAIDLSRNSFSKLDSIFQVSKDSLLTFLDISYNKLSGDLPDCWSNFKELSILVLANNKFSGKIPASIGSLTGIATLNLGNNYFTQELPSLKSCKYLEAINVAENRLFGPIPTWIGESLSSLVIISLRSNNFSGSIPSHLCHLSNLQLLDLSSNDLSGSLPKCLNNLSALKREGYSGFTTISHDYTYGSNGSTVYKGYDYQLQLVWKGTLSTFGNTLALVKSIDLSNNMLNGEIPTEITELIELVFLNLSRNHLSGQIPPEIGDLNLLDALDLSNNQLSGGIPSSLSQVPRLNTLDLSNNNLSGKIPISTQLQSFEVRRTNCSYSS